ncbi:hypothetical protein EV421DRAFT_1828034 [Armillaria borealis]|uniref:Uncharacterized protein n=1 Tax=Armillaria borealis TaxID=47425 RepID=A0AA39J895_9AGAR|nr:hypothetical protein EV421DRAFT_1828034 [Armillaria borealis]
MYHLSVSWHYLYQREIHRCLIFSYGFVLAFLPFLRKPAKQKIHISVQAQIVRLALAAVSIHDLVLLYFFTR